MKAQSKHSSCSDLVLIELFKNGDSHAFGILITRHSSQLSNLIFGIVKDGMLTEDILQETFIKAIDAIKSNKFDGTNFIGWLSVIARNKCMDYLRTKKKHVQSSTQYNFFHSQSFRAELKTNEDKIFQEAFQFLLTLFAQLAPEQREVLILRLYYNLSFKEIAKHFGDISVNTCTGRMRYALINLKKLITKHRCVSEKLTALLE